MTSAYAHHPDRLKWNDRFQNEDHVWGFEPSPLLQEILKIGIPDGPVLELACGISGNALALAESGREVLSVDISDIALDRLMSEARSRGLVDRITSVQADLPTWRSPEDQKFALVVCVMYWDPMVFDYAFEAVADGGVIAWQAFTKAALKFRPSMPSAICLKPDEPASRLPASFTVLEEQDIEYGERAVRRMIAKKRIM